jgi:internalin A
MSAPTRIFVSYSHEDSRWLNELNLVLAPLIRDERIALWDDKAISSGMQWRPEIEAQLRTANVGVLLVSANFFASRFISDVELPAILKRAEQNTLRLLWIAVSPSLVSQTPLYKFQAVNDPKRPIDSMDKPQRLKVWVRNCRGYQGCIRHFRHRRRTQRGRRVLQSGSFRSARPRNAD